MEHLQAADLLRFAEKEAEMLQQMQVKISNELHRLQVEEELFVRTMERLKENSKKSNKMQDGEEEARRNCEDAEGNKAGLELLEALQVELAQFSVLRHSNVISGGSPQNLMAILFLQLFQSCYFETTMHVTCKTCKHHRRQILTQVLLLIASLNTESANCKRL